MTDQPITLPQSYLDRANARIRLSHLEDDLAGIEIALTPEEYWPGKNSEQREVEKARALAADPGYSACKKELQGAKDNLETIEAQIALLEAERRNGEWIIRGKLVEALAAIYARPDTPAETPEQMDGAFDRTADNVALVQAIQGIPLEAILEPEPTLANLAEEAAYEGSDYGYDDSIPF